ncbi:MAG: hypothetical protein UV01_C0001G0082 [Parcubacteria group bacterium GW2011_GWA2_42_14]|nr:MAG: hypothetical protein UV01_C0001G0082 [Parcubacteria group bacterium GW2011_GWA2_42_14]
MWLLLFLAVLALVAIVFGIDKIITLLEEILAELKKLNEKK